MPNFQLGNIPDLSGKVALVTGGNTGIGYVVCRELARKKAHVVMACRSEEKAKAAIKAIKEETHNDQLEFLQLDLSDLHNVKAAADNFLSRGLPLHILINNAGIGSAPFTLTKDGIESTMAINHVGPHYFTSLLVPKLIESAPARVVFTSSVLHSCTLPGGIPFDALNDPKIYSTMNNYGTSKLANILDTKAFAEQLKDKGVLVNVIHPGFVKTEIGRNAKQAHGSLVAAGFAFAIKYIAVSPDKGALTTLYAATSENFDKEKITGEYFVPYGEKEAGSKLARDEGLRKRLWEWTEKTIAEKMAPPAHAEAAAVAVEEGGETKESEQGASVETPTPVAVTTMEATVE